MTKKNKILQSGGKINSKEILKHLLITHYMFIIKLTTGIFCCHFSIPLQKKQNYAP